METKKTLVRVVGDGVCVRIVNSDAVTVQKAFDSLAILSKNRKLKLHLSKHGDREWFEISIPELRGNRPLRESVAWTIKEQLDALFFLSQSQQHSVA